MVFPVGSGFFSLRKHLYMLWALNRTPKMQPILLGKQIFVESREAEGDPTGTNDFRREPKAATQLIAVYVPWRVGEEKGKKKCLDIGRVGEDFTF